MLPPGAGVCAEGLAAVLHPGCLLHLLGQPEALPVQVPGDRGLRQAASLPRHRPRLPTQPPQDIQGEQTLLLKTSPENYSKSKNLSQKYFITKNPNTSPSLVLLGPTWPLLSKC